MAETPTPATEKKKEVPVLYTEEQYNEVKKQADEATKKALDLEQRFTALGARYNKLFSLYAALLDTNLEAAQNEALQQLQQRQQPAVQMQ